MLRDREGLTSASGSPNTRRHRWPWSSTPWNTLSRIICDSLQKIRGKGQKVEQKMGGNNVLGLNSWSASSNLLRDVLYLDAWIWLNDPERTLFEGVVQCGEVEADRQARGELYTRQQSAMEGEEARSTHRFCDLSKPSRNRPSSDSGAPEQWPLYTLPPSAAHTWRPTWSIIISLRLPAIPSQWRGWGGQPTFAIPVSNNRLTRFRITLHNNIYFWGYHREYRSSCAKAKVNIRARKLAMWEKTGAVLVKWCFDTKRVARQIQPETTRHCTHWGSIWRHTQSDPSIPLQIPSSHRLSEGTREKQVAVVESEACN